MTRNGNLTPERRRRYWRITLASVVLMVVGAMALPLTGYLYVGLKDAYAQGSADDANPRANLLARGAKGGSPARVPAATATARSPVARCPAATPPGLEPGDGQPHQQQRAELAPDPQSRHRGLGRLDPVRAHRHHAPLLRDSGQRQAGERPGRA